jgi:hypothetical protein
LFLIEEIKDRTIKKPKKGRVMIRKLTTFKIQKYFEGLEDGEENSSGDEEFEPEEEEEEEGERQQAISYGLQTL